MYPFVQPKSLGAGIQVDQDFEGLRQLTNQIHKSEKVWGIIQKVFAVLYLFLMARGFLNGMTSVLEGEKRLGSLVSEMAAMVFFACGMVYLFTQIYYPSVKAKKAALANEYLKGIHVDNNKDLMNILIQMNCAAIKNVYMDETGNVCIQGKKGKHTFIQKEGILTISSDREKFKRVLERHTIAGTLLKFIAPDAPVNAFRNERRNARLAKTNGILAILAIVSVGLFLFGDISPDLLDRNQRFIRIAKDGCPEAYPHISFGQAFEDFFGDCSWEYYKSVDDLDVVEFNGTCLYNGENAKVAIQFIVHYEKQTCEVYALALNGNPQTELVKNLFMLRVFESYGIPDDSGSLNLEQEKNALESQDGKEEQAVKEESESKEEQASQQEEPESEEEQASQMEEPEDDSEHQVKVSFEELDALAGRWSDGKNDLSISIYSDASDYSIGDEIGTFSIEEISGLVYLWEAEDDALDILCLTRAGTNLELHYNKASQTMEVKEAGDELDIEAGTRFECVEKFES